MEIEPVADSAAARKVFEMENAIESDDARYFYDDVEQEQLRAAKPWSQDPRWFKRVHISAVALIKMVMHARSGGNIEIMGSMQGKISEKERAFVILDVFPLPVEGTETRVNAGQEANEFQVNYTAPCPKVGRRENYVGWYHSHPGYGCWLSGIDVQTQSTHQQYNDPSIAIVIDPIRTMSAGKVDLGAFRTYPQSYINNNKKNKGGAGSSNSNGGGEYQSIPIDKIEDFGVHCESYYQLEVTYFKSALDSSVLDHLWNKYWARALSTSSLIQSNDYVVKQMKDISSKLSQTSNHLCKAPLHMRRSIFMHDRRNGNGNIIGTNSSTNSNSNSSNTAIGKANTQLEAIARDANKCCGEHSQALMTMWLKRQVMEGCINDGPGLK